MRNQAEIRIANRNHDAAECASIMVKHPRIGVAEMRLGQFSGGGLLDLALAGCVFNNVVRTAAERGIRIDEARVNVSGVFQDDGTSTGIDCQVDVVGDAGSEQLRALAREAFEESTVAAVLKRAGRVRFNQI